MVDKVYANSVHSFSSEDSSLPASNVLGAPNWTWWSPTTAGAEWIVVEFATSVNAEGVTVWHDYVEYAGTIKAIDLWNGPTSSWDNVWTGTTQYDTEFRVTFSRRDYATNRVRVSVDGWSLDDMPYIEAIGLVSYSMVAETDDAPVRATFTLDGWNPAKGPGIGLENFDVWSDHTGGSLTTRYLRGDRVDQLLGRYEPSGATAGRYWNLTDNLGSIRAVLNDSGQVKTAITYDAFGNITKESNPTYRGRYAWTGREIEVEIGHFSLNATGLGDSLPGDVAFG